jgi:DNA-binding CsgD family transcriptional regulator
MWATYDFWQHLSQQGLARLLPIDPHRPDIRALMSRYPGLHIYLDLSATQNSLLELSTPQGPAYLLLLTALPPDSPPIHEGGVVETALEALKSSLAPHLGGKHRATSSESPLSLSAREVEVLDCVARGLTNSEIAYKLSISNNTVGFHLKNIFYKLGVGNRTEASRWYFAHYSSYS